MHPESEQRAAGRLGSLLLLFERGGQENGALTQRVRHCVSIGHVP